MTSKDVEHANVNAVLLSKSTSTDGESDETELSSATTKKNGSPTNSGSGFSAEDGGKSYITQKIKLVYSYAVWRSYYTNCIYITSHCIAMHCIALFHAELYCAIGLHVFFDTLNNIKLLN